MTRWLRSHADAPLAAEERNELRGVAAATLSPATVAQRNWPPLSALPDDVSVISAQLPEAVLLAVRNETQPTFSTSTHTARSAGIGCHENAPVVAHQPDPLPVLDTQIRRVRIAEEGERRLLE